MLAAFEFCRGLLFLPAETLGNNTRNWVGQEIVVYKRSDYFTEETQKIAIVNPVGAAAEDGGFPSEASFLPDFQMDFKGHV